MDLKAILSAGMPMLATAIGGPFGLLASGAIAKVFGLTDNATDQQIANAVANATPEQVLALKQAENSFTEHMAAMGYDNTQKLAALLIEDRKSAREMQVSTRSKIPGVLALAIVVAWAGVQCFLLTHVIDPTMRELIARVLGTLDGALMLVLSFYFGSSASSQQKTELLAAKQTQGSTS